MDKKTFIILLVALLVLVPLASAAYATYRHAAFEIADGKDINLMSNSIGNGSIFDVACSSNCTGFGGDTSSTDVQNITASQLTAGTGINISSSANNDTVTISNTATGGLSLFYLYNDSVMNTTLNINGKKSTVISYGSDDTLLKEWESPVINISSTGNGVAEVHIHALETAANKGSKIYAKWFKNVSSTETLLATSALSAEITSTETAYELNQAVEIQAVNNSDTFIIRLYGNTTGSGGNASLTLNVEGDTLSRFELPVPIITGVAGEKGDTGATGDTGAAGTNGTNGTDAVNFTLNKYGETQLTGNVSLVAGSNMTLTQSGNNITIDSTALFGKLSIVQITGNGAVDRAVAHGLGVQAKGWTGYSSTTNGHSYTSINGTGKISSTSTDTLYTTPEMNTTHIYVGSSTGAIANTNGLPMYFLVWG